jgi:hypothetical protein
MTISFTALLGYDFIKYDWANFGASRQDYILDNFEVLNAGSAESDANSGSATHSGLVSYFGRLNYAFRDKYLFEANLREMLLHASRKRTVYHISSFFCRMESCEGIIYG